MSSASAIKQRSWPRRPFLVFQVVMWSLLATTDILPALRSPELSAAAMLRWTATWALGAACVSTLVACILTRIPHRKLQGSRAGWLCMLLAIAAGLTWSGLLTFLAPWLGGDPFAPAGVNRNMLLFAGTIRGTVMFGLWTGVFMVNLLSLRVQRVREQSVRAHAAADQAQLQLLRGQLNPHFLFNVLNSVVALIGENPRAAQGMVRDVAMLLRRALDTNHHRDVTVRQELEFIRLYLKCEQMRFEDRLQVTFDVEHGLEDLLVPPMLVHVLVENAVKHGMQSAVVKSLQVRIVVVQSGDSVVFTVANTGSLTAAAGSLSSDSTGIGLVNVKERLAQLFPGSHRFSLREDPGWVVAELELPAKESA